jgi:hypothetical protein
MRFRGADNSRNPFGHNYRKPACDRRYARQFCAYVSSSIAAPIRVSDRHPR